MSDTTSSKFLARTLAMLADHKPGEVWPSNRPSFDAGELDALGAILRKLIYAPEPLRDVLQQKFGVTLTRADFYSEIPTVRDILASTAKPSQLLLDEIFDEPAKYREILTGLIDIADEFTPPRTTTTPGVFSWDNTQFSYSDAVAYYALIRSRKPRHIVEIGSGWSTLVAKMAVERNGSGRITCIEPFPSENLRSIEGITLVIQKAQDISSNEISDMLQDGDFLFIDSTHTVKHDSDCLHIYLRLLPSIKSNIVVHAHDIYLPFPIPTDRMLRHQIYWNEQYLLYAYLLGNPRCRTLFGSRYHVAHNSDLLTQLMHGRFPPGGGSYWFEQSGKAEI